MEWKSRSEQFQIIYVYLYSNGKVRQKVGVPRGALAKLADVDCVECVLILELTGRYRLKNTLTSLHGGAVLTRAQACTTPGLFAGSDSLQSCFPSGII